jgi:hypothetical protein
MGGHALPDVGKIHKSEIEDTVKKFINEFNISEYKILGSAGKKEFSGDIDIGVNYINIDNLSLYTSRKTSALHIKYPIVNFHKRNDDQTGYVQIDIIQGDLNWLQFYYISCPNSAYTGTDRNRLLSACSYSSRTIKYENDKMVYENGFVYSPKGVLYRTKEKSKKIIHNIYTNIDSLKLFLNENTICENMITFENIMEEIKNFDIERKKKIYRHFTENMIESEIKKLPNEFLSWR